MTDYVTTTINAIVAKLGQDAYWSQTVKPANTISYMKGRWPNKLPAKDAGDFPQFTIELKSHRTKRLCPTFLNTSGPNGDVVIEQSVIFRITISHDGQNVNVPNQLLAQFNALMLPDPKLGLPFVKSSGEATGTQKMTSIAGTKRLLQEIDFPVTFILHKNDLVPA